jgi:hypothetical protein
MEKEMVVAKRTCVTFQSSRFNSTEPRDYYVNPDCFGDDVCRLFSEELRNHQIKSEDPIPEDWGWRLYVKSADGKFSLNTNYHVDGFWLLFVKAHNDGLLNLFRKQERGVPLELTRMVNSILMASGATDVAWHIEQEFDRGIYEHGVGQPE